MKPLVFNGPYALVFWSVFVWAFGIESRLLAHGQERASRSQDAGSMWLIVLANYVGVGLAFVFAYRLPGFAIASPWWAFGCGIAVIVAGSLLRRHCFQILGEHFTPVVTVRPEQPIIDRGAYRLLRHPSYAAGILMLSGIGLALGNWASVAALAAISLAAYLYRVAVEERALAATLGEPYVAYMRRTRRFIPYVF